MRRSTDTKAQIEAIAEDGPNDLLEKGRDGLYHLELGEIDNAVNAPFEDEHAGHFETIMQLLRAYIADRARVEQLVQIESAHRTSWKDFFFHANNPEQEFEAGVDLLAVVGNITFVGEATKDDGKFAAIAFTEITEQATSRPGHIAVSLWSDQLDIFKNCRIGDQIIAIGQWNNFTASNGRRFMRMSLIVGNQFRRVVKADNHHLELEYLYTDSEPQHGRDRDYGLEL
jgi:hypothetical protein